MAALTLLHTPVELGQNVVQQHVAQGLKVLREDVADGVKRVVTGGGHPLRLLGSHGVEASTTIGSGQKRSRRRRFQDGDMDECRDLSYLIL